MSEEKLALLVDRDPKGVGHCGTDQTRLDSHPEAFPSALLKNVVPARVKSTVEQAIYWFIGPRLRNLNHSLYYVLWVGEDPAAQTRENSDNQPLGEIEVWVIF